MKFSKTTMIPIDKLKLYEHNVNTMDDEMLNSLVEEIQNEGFDEPLQVVKDPDVKGFYIVIGGNHRLKACRVLGFKELPCVIKNWDDIEQKTKMVKRNVLRGDIDKKKFNELVRDIERDAEMSLTEISEEMGMGEGDFLKHYKEDIEKEDKKEKEKIESVESATDDGFTAMKEDLSFLISNILAEYGDTVPLGFICFTCKGKVHLLTRADDELAEVLKEMCVDLKNNEKDINEALLDAFEFVRKGKKKK